MTQDASKFERRGKPRLRLTQLARGRPSQTNDFGEIQSTINSGREGVYFGTELKSYFKGMRLLVTVPYSTQHGAINQEYIGEVVRIDALAEGIYGIAVHLKQRINWGTYGTVRRQEN
jgi:hypothetical protein